MVTGSTTERLYIISVRNKWGVYKRHAKRAIRVFKHRDLAFHFAAQLNVAATVTKPEYEIIVFNKMGEVDFKY